jgi:hypothetical protein
MLTTLPPQGAAEYRYAVAVRDGDNPWLVLWIRRSRNGEVFVMKPGGDRDWDIDTSYHRDGTVHMKSYGRRMIQSYPRQPPAGKFRGTEHLGADYGFVSRGVGAICELSDFSGMVEMPIGVLGLVSGGVSVDLSRAWRDTDARSLDADCPPKGIPRGCAVAHRHGSHE